MNKTDIKLTKYSNKLFKSIAELIGNTQNRVAISLNAETTLLYWSIGNYINTDLKASGQITYGSKILATLSQQLTQSFGKGYTYTALTRMCKVAIAIDEPNIATLSQQLSWSHLIELAAIDDLTKREFYTQLGKFKPKHKAQMELYLRWLQKYEMQQGEETPIGLLLCSEGNTEHIELLMLDEKEIKVAQYLTELPSKKWFADKLHRAMEIVRNNNFKHD